MHQPFPYRTLVLSLATLFVLAAGGNAAVIYHFGHDLPRRLELTSSYRPSVISTVYDTRGQPIGEFYHQRRIVVPLQRLPLHVIHAFLAAEDARLFRHHGVDLFAITRAFLSNLRRGEIREGGSTITQQLVGIFFLTPQRTLRRKIREAILAFRVERNHTKEAYRESLRIPLRLTPSQDLNSQIAPYFVEHIRRTIGDRYGFGPLLQGGLQIHTALDSSMQMSAQKAVRDGLDELRLRHKRKSPAQEPDKGDVEAALIAMDPHTGMVRALVGGYDFSLSQFNRVLQARRQPGSAFKPIIYSAALDTGLSQLSIIQDGPLSFRMGPGKFWRPQNYQNRFFGPVTLRSALAHSLNSVAVRLAERVGVDRVIRQALSPEVAYVVTDMLKNVIQSGTGRAVARLGAQVAGKTGSSSDFRDGWFIGYTPDLIAGVWVGYDDYRTLGEQESGARTALPLWFAFMKEAWQGGAAKEFPVPEGIGWLEVQLKDGGYPLPLFESSLQTRIPYVVGSKMAPPRPSKEKGPDGEPDDSSTDLSDIAPASATGQPDS